VPRGSGAERGQVWINGTGRGRNHSRLARVRLRVRPFGIGTLWSGEVRSVPKFIREVMPWFLGVSDRFSEPEKVAYRQPAGILVGAGRS